MKISKKVWEEESSLGKEEKENKILEVLGKEIMDIEEIRKLSGEKWVWGSLKKMEEDEKLESKKIGKRKFYRRVE